MSSAAANSAKLKVFISYSRRDLEFADQLVAVLKLQDFDHIIDRVGIHAAENWEKRLSQLILQSDIVVFVLSPDSASSDICGWEVAEAIRLRCRTQKQRQDFSLDPEPPTWCKARKLWPYHEAKTALK